MIKLESLFTDYHALYYYDITTTSPSIRYGVYKFASGAQYSGGFLNNCYHGQGEYMHASGAVYVGNYSMGERDGYGVLRGADNTIIFDGYWKNGKKLQSSLSNKGFQ